MTGLAPNDVLTTDVFLARPSGGRPSVGGQTGATPC